MLNSCPGPNQLRALFDGCLSEPDAVRLGVHVDECSACQDLLQYMTSEVADMAHCARNGRAKTMVVEPALREAMEQLKESPLATAEFPEDETEDFAANVLRPADKPGILGLLGSYEILQIIGTGGMGRVYKAMDPTLNRFVAIKIIAPQLSTSKGARKRFAREARAAAAISHENVVQIYSVPEVDGIPYLVMEFVPGISLQQKLDQREPIELKEILRIGQQTAAGLAAAHAQGLIHRDIKPPNILLERGQDRVKITDFGLARMVDDASLTQSGVLAGTPQFMAPEQARGEAQDHRVDLFSLGSVLYTLCTGTPPFRANTTMAVLRQVSDQGPQPIRELNPRIPTWLCAIIAKLHEKDPNDRFQTAKGVADLLGQCLAHVQDPVRFPMPEWRDKRSILGRRFLKPTSRAAILGFLVALVGAVGFWQGWQAISWATNHKPDMATNQPPEPATIPGEDSGMTLPSEFADAGLNKKEIVEKTLGRLLEERKVLDARVAALQGDLERVHNQISTSRTHPKGDRTKLSVSNRVSERSTISSGLKVPHQRDAKALAMSPDGRHVAVAEGDDKIHTYVFSQQKNAEFWMAALPEEFDPVQARVRELQQRYLVVRNEIPKNIQSRVWADALTATLQEYLDRMPRVIIQHQRLERLQKELDAVATTRDGKGFAVIRSGLNRQLDEARKDLVNLEDRLRTELRRGVMTHIQARFSDVLEFDPEQLTAIEVLIKTVNAEAQRQRARPSSLLHESPDWLGEIHEESCFTTNCKSLSCLDYSADGKFLIGSGCGHELFVWNARTGAEVNRLRGHEAPVTKFAVCPETEQVVSWSTDGNVRLWMPDAREGTVVAKKHWQSGLRDLAISASGEWLTILTKRGQLQCWQNPEGEEWSHVWSSSDLPEGKAISILPDQKLTACLTSDSTVLIYDGQTGEKLRALNPTSSQWTCMTFVAQSNSLVLGGRDGTISYYDTQTWLPQGFIQVESSPPVGLSVTPNGRLIGVRQANGHACLLPVSVQGSRAGLPTYSSVEVGNLFPTWFRLNPERITR